MYIKAYIQNLVKNDPVVSEKSNVLFSYVTDLGQRSRYDIDLQYSYTFMNFISCLHLLTFKSQAAIVLEKIKCFHFFL